MHIRLMAVLLAAGLCVIPALAEKKKADNAPETAPQPTTPALAQASHQLPVIAPSPAPRQLQCPQRHVTPNVEEFVAPPPPVYQAPTTCPAPESIENHVTKVYTVADLVVPLPMAGAGAGQLIQPPTTCEAQLIERITTAVEPKTWSKSGGKGTIDYFPIGMALVVHQPPAVQAKIEQYLDTLRKVQDQQVVTQLQIITVSDKWFANSGLAKEFIPAGTQTPCKFLTPAAASKLMRSCQEDGATKVHQAPMMTCLNGQPARVKVGQIEHFVTGITIKYMDGKLTYTPKNVAQDIGTEVTIEPTVAADGKSIAMIVAGAVREHGIIPVPSTPVTTLIGQAEGTDKPLAQEIQEPKIIVRAFEGRLGMPDGGSALLYGGKATIERTETETIPSLSKTPHLAELFHNVSKQTETNHLLVLVTSRVVSPDVVQAECTECPKCDNRLGKLLADYTRACKEGKVEDARRLAIECLAIDPMCFAKK